MELFFREYGEPAKPPLIVFHGLLGSSRNWQAAGADLGRFFRVYCLDLRNHGKSPHAFPHSYRAMMNDVFRWMDVQGLGSSHFLGHSMGGKLAMKIACERSERLRSLVVVDIAPKRYPNSHDSEYEAMRLIDLSALPSRMAADRFLADAVPDRGKRQFLLTNLAKREDGNGFRWIVNLDALEKNQREIEESPIGPDHLFEGRTLFIVGGRSDYFDESDNSLVGRSFPNAIVKRIEKSGHNPHFEFREEFVSLVAKFSKPIEGG
ncbi:MAG: alpha/beta fold hydrolase [Opitutaceae bacterium]|nr:alpha/beta fold hydrolase [Opitutaceae bacterium]